MAQESRQRAASCDFGAIVASQEAIRVFWLPPSDGALYSSGKILLADLKTWRVENPEGALTSQGCSSYLAGMAETRSRVAREVSWRGDIRVDDGGEATGQSSLRSSPTPRDTRPHG